MFREFYEWDYRAAKAGLDRAEEIGPNVARFHMWMEFYFKYVEYDCGAALAANHRARELNPLDLTPPVRPPVPRSVTWDPTVSPDSVDRTYGLNGPLVIRLITHVGLCLQDA